MLVAHFRRTAQVVLIAMMLPADGLLAQLRPVPEELIGERLVAVVPLIGTGKAGDPIRPKYAPMPVFVDAKRPGGAPAPPPPPPRPDWEKLKPEEKTEVLRQQIQGFSYVLTDDKKRAIVEFVAGDRKAFAEILKDKDVQAFEPKDYHSSKGKRDEVETELKKSKKDFDLRQLRTKGF